MSNDLYTLDASVREDLGKGASRRLRKTNAVPAVLYGCGKDPVSLTLAHNKVMQAQDNEGFYAHILTLNIDGKAVEAVIKDIQRHPFKRQIMHLDFQRVDAKQELHVSVPLHFINEADVIKAGATVSHTMNELEVTCLPKNLPEFIEVDLAGMEVGQSLHISDIKLPEGVTSVELSKGEGHDQSVVSAMAPKGVSDEDEEAAAAEGETPEDAAE